MHTGKWTEEIDKITAGFRSEFGSLTAEELNWKPNPDKWSIGQIIDHLIVINSTYYPTFDQLKNNTYKVPFPGRFDFYTNMMGSLILKSVLPETTRKTKTFPIWQPTQSNIDADILEKFASAQEVLKQRIEENTTRLDERTVISSPANKNVTYKLETAFDIIVAHEKRHFNQAKELKALMKNEG